MTEAQLKMLRDVEIKQNELADTMRTLLEVIELRDSKDRNHFYEFSLQNVLQHVIDHMDNTIEHLFEAIHHNE